MWRQSQSVNQCAREKQKEDCTYDGKVPRPVFSPVTHTVEDRATRGIERHAHVVVAFVRDERCAGAALIVAVVVFCAT